MHPVILLALLVGVLILASWMKRAPPQQRQRALKRLLLGGGLALLVILAATGRLHWMFAAIGAAVPMVLRLFQVLQTVQLFKNAKSAHKAAQAPSTGQTSEIETRFLRMRLHHDTGAMSGEVREGRFQGRELETLQLEQLLELWAECRLEDAQSATVLETYLDRTFGDEWRERAEKAEQEAAGDDVGQGTMTHAEACEILGLTPGADREEVLKAHRRLMQKLHPDRGGSNYLAAKINRAKDLLLGT